MRLNALRTCGAVTVCLALSSAGMSAQKTARGGSVDAAWPERIWQETAAPAALDLFYGAGGRADAPDPSETYRFVKEDLAGTSPKFDVVDGQGVTWKVKLGEESQTEVAATRLVWAAGYFTDEDYYLAELTVTGLPALKRGQQFVSPAGVVHSARMERKPVSAKKLGTWDWFDNPFVGTRELNGLRVMMSLLNNWDLKTINNAIEAMSGERRYVVADLGATFGNTGNYFTRSKGVPEAYAKSAFVAAARPDSVDFVLHSRPFVLSAVDLANYRTRTRMEEVTKRIPLNDARWLAQRLSLLSVEQIRDCFRAAGYRPEVIEIYTETVRKRIAELGAL